MREPTEQDIRAADRANLYAGAAPIDLTLRAAAMRQMAAYERAQRTPRFHQVAEGLTIDRDGAAWWGSFYVEGRFIADRELCRRAQRDAIELAHSDALREDARRTRQGETSPEVAA